jgi:hypothetical protein
MLAGDPGVTHRPVVLAPFLLERIIANPTSEQAPESTADH